MRLDSDSRIINFSYVVPTRPLEQSHGSGTSLVDIPLDVTQSGDPTHNKSTKGVLYFSGYGEGRYSTQSFHKEAIEQGVPLTTIKIHFSDISPLIARTRELAIEHTLRTTVPEFIEDWFNSIEKVPAITNSLGSAILGYALHETSKVADIDLINPLGFSTKPNESIEKSTAWFLWRYAKALLKTKPYEQNAVRASIDVTKELTKDTIARSIRTQLSMANRLSFISTYANHAQNNCVRVRSGTNDSLFTTHDIRKTLYESVQTSGSTPTKIDVLEEVGVRHQDIALKDVMSVAKSSLTHLANNL